jgi:hypothetical protein
MAGGTARQLSLQQAFTKPALFVSHHDLRARRTTRLRTRRAQIGGRQEGRQERRNVSARSPLVPLTSNRGSHRRTLASLLLPDVLALSYDVLRGLDYLRNAGVKPDSRVREAVEIVIKRRHQNGRWPLNLLHRERIPLEMEIDVGRARLWNTVRALRVLRWYYNSCLSCGLPQMEPLSQHISAVPISQRQAEVCSEPLKASRCEPRSLGLPLIPADS